MLTETVLPLAPSVAAAMGSSNGSDRFLIGSYADLVARAGELSGSYRLRAQDRCSDEWAGGLGYEATLRVARDGDPSLVAASDALLSRYEDMAPASRRVRTVASVCGGAPNVGAYLAGSPVSMRRRQAMLDDAGPLTLVVDVASSAGITTEQLMRRGSAVLALARVLQSARPVSVYVGVSLCARSDRSKACHVYGKLDDPLDLSRAAWALSSPGFPRGLLYATGEEVLRGSGTVSWPYDSAARLMRLHAHEILSRVLSGTEILFVGAAFLDDQNVKNPEQWLADMLAEYGVRDDSQAA